MARISMTMMVLRMLGSVICQMLCRRVAPSTLADSYWLGSTPEMAARKMMDHQPISFQISDRMASVQ